MNLNNAAPAPTAEEDELELDRQFADAFTDKVNVSAPAPTEETSGVGADAGAAEGEPPTFENLQRRLDQMAQNERMQNGRTSALARENNALKAQLAELAAAQQKATQPAEPQPEVDDADDALREAPDLSRAVERRIAKSTLTLKQQLEESRAQLAQMGQMLQQTQQAVMPLHEAQRQQTIQNTHTAMDELFTPTWRDEVRSERYAAWLDRQPPAIRDLAVQCVTPSDTAQVLRLYFSEHGTSTPRPAAARPAQTPSQDRLRQASGIPSRSAPVASAPGTTDADLDAAFAAAFRG